MIEEKPRPRQIRQCKLCEQRSMHIETVTLSNGSTMEVGRCIQCDSLPCPECKGRNLDPGALDCKHCGARIAMAPAKSEGE